MSIKRTIITAIVGLTLVALVAPIGNVQAVTIDELLAQIAQLQAQLIALQGNTGATPVPTGNVACAGVTFTRNLVVGSTGSDVKCLQVLLNTNGYTLATTGAGSPGMETSYFGPITLVAVKSFQAAKGWTPANQVGPLTRAALNGLLGTAVVTPGQPPVVVPTGAGLTVQLASDNPAAGTVVDGQGMAPLAKLTFVNGDSSEIKVTSLKVKRFGISPDSTLGNVYLFDGARRLTDSASVASTMITFNDSTGIFTVPANSSKTISILADTDGAVGETVGVQLVAAIDVTTNASSVNGLFPVTGNLFTLASGTSLATIHMADETGTVTPADADIDPQNDYAIWYDSAVIGTRAVNLHRVAFRVGGSVNRTTDVQNFRLLIDGVQAGSAVANADVNDYVTFDLTAAPVKLETGTRVIKVLADIIGGSNKNVYLSLRTAADMTAVDSQFGATLVLHRYTNSGSFSVMDSGTQSINSGTLTVTKLTTSPSGNVVDIANNQVLAKYELKAAGERVKIESLRVSATISDGNVGQLRNGAVYANGVQIGSTTDLEEDSESTPYTTYNFGSSLIVEPGSPVTLEVRADIYDNDGTNTALDTDTILVKIVGGDLNNAYGMTSMATVDVPSASVSANTLTVATGGLTLSKYTAYTNQNAVLPVTDYKLGHFTLTANTTEAVNINTIEVGLNSVSGVTSNLYVKFGTNTTATKATVTVANTWSVNYQLAAGQTVDVLVYGDVATNAATAVTGLYIAGTTASSATSTTQGTTPQIGGSTIVGQTITFTTGTPTTAVDGSTPLAQAVAGGQTVVAGKFKLTAQNDSYTIKEVRFTVAGTAATSAVINSLTLKDGSTVTTVPYDGANDQWAIAGLNILVPANTTKVLTAEYNLATPSTDGTTITTGKVATLTLSYMNVANSQGTESQPTTARTANYTYVYKSIPTFTNVAVTGQGVKLTSGVSTELIKFTVAADSKGPVSLKQIRFNTNITDGGTASAPTLNTFTFFRGTTNITGSVAIIDDGGATLESTTTTLTELNTSDVFVVFDTEEVIPAGTTYTYTLLGTPSGFIGESGDADSVATSITQDTVPSDGTADGGAAGANQTGFYLDATATTGVVQTLATTVAEAGTGTGSTSNGNVIWSDNSATLHDYTYDASSADWFNGYLIDSLPLSGSAINYNN